MHAMVYVLHMKKTQKKAALTIKQISVFISKGAKLHVYVCACDNIFIILVERLAVAVDS